MSISFSLQMPPCDHCGNGGGDVMWTDTTHNLCSLWRELGVIDALYESDGKTAAEIVDVVEQGLDRLCDDMESFRKFDSPNGWGKVENAVRFLWKIYRGCKQYPKATIRVSK